VLFGLDLHAFDKGCEQMEDLQFILGAIEKRIRSMVPFYKIPFLKYILPFERKLAFHIKRYSTFQKNLLEEQQQQVQQEKESGLINPLQKKQESQLMKQFIRACSDPEEVTAAGKGELKLTAYEILGNIQTIFLAGMETTANTMAFALYELAKSPDIQEKVHEEAMDVLGSSGGHVKNIEQIKELKYASAVFHEALRLHGPVPWLIHQNSKDTELGGHKLPENTLVAVALKLQDLSEERYTSADRFVPDRWLQQQLKDNQEESTKIPESFQFGSGTRVCPGKGLALQEAPIFLSTLLYHFKISMPSSQPKVGRQARFVMRPDKKISLILKPRNMASI